MLTTRATVYRIARALTVLLLFATGPAHAEELLKLDLSSPLVDTSSPGGTVTKGPRPLYAYVRLPDGYDHYKGRRYPVLWLLHGANGDATRWDLDDFAGLDAILVMPEGGVLGMYTDWYNGGAFGSPQWTTYQLEYVRDEIHKRFRIRPERRWHAIAGISMGGQGALRFASLLPGYFGSVAGLSAAFPNTQAPEAVFGIPAVTGTAYEAIFGPVDGAYATGMSSFALASNMEHSRVYLLSGDGTNCPGDPKGGTFDLDVITEKAIRNQQAPYAAELQLAGADVTTRTPCGVHTFGVWTRAFADLRATWGFFQPVPEHPRQWTYRTARLSGEMWGLEFRFDERPTELAEFKRDGSRLSATGTGTVTITGDRCSFTAELPFERRIPPGC
jgi:S-formylglutathione hydrolase FrmB